MSINEIRVRMAEYSVGMSPDVLVTIGLGSCIGIALYDKFNKIGGLVHIMLPESNNSSRPAKYANTAVPFLIKKMTNKGASRSNIIAKIVGGAQMFNISNESNMQIGKRNIEAVCKVLQKENVVIKGKDTGEDFGRTMRFYTETGKVKVSSYKRDEIIL